jgi:hypothetical protein
MASKAQKASRLSNFHNFHEWGRSEDEANDNSLQVAVPRGWLDLFPETLYPKSNHKSMTLGFNSVDSSSTTPKVSIPPPDTLITLRLCSGNEVYSNFCNFYTNPPPAIFIIHRHNGSKTAELHYGE